MTAPPVAPIRVLIADDHALFSDALAAVLATDRRLHVAGRASDGREAVELTRSLRPDVVLMDISMPVMDGIEATARIRAERTAPPVVILTGSSSSADVGRAREVGASAYVTKDRISSDLIDTIVRVAPSES